MRVHSFSLTRRLPMPRRPLPGTIKVRGGPGRAVVSARYSGLRVSLMSTSRSTYDHSSVLRRCVTSLSKLSEAAGAYSNQVRKSKS